MDVKKGMEVLKDILTKKVKENQLDNDFDIKIEDEKGKKVLKLMNLKDNKVVYKVELSGDAESIKEIENNLEKLKKEIKAELVKLNLDIQENIEIADLEKLSSEKLIELYMYIDTNNLEKTSLLDETIEKVYVERLVKSLPAKYEEYAKLIKKFSGKDNYLLQQTRIALVLAMNDESYYKKLISDFGKQWIQGVLLKDIASDPKFLINYREYRDSLRYRNIYRCKGISKENCIKINAFLSAFLDYYQQPPFLYIKNVAFFVNKLNDILDKHMLDAIIALDRKLIEASENISSKDYFVNLVKKRGLFGALDTLADIHLSKLNLPDNTKEFIKGAGIFLGIGLIIIGIFKKLGFGKGLLALLGLGIAGSGALGALDAWLKKDNAERLAPEGWKEVAKKASEIMGGIEFLKVFAKDLTVKELQSIIVNGKVDIDKFLKLVKQKNNLLYEVLSKWDKKKLSKLVAKGMIGLGLAKIDLNDPSKLIVLSISNVNQNVGNYVKGFYNNPSNKQNVIQAQQQLQNPSSVPNSQKQLTNPNKPQQNQYDPKKIDQSTEFAEVVAGPVLKLPEYRVHMTQKKEVKEIHQVNSEFLDMLKKGISLETMPSELQVERILDDIIDIWSIKIKHILEDKWGLINQLQHGDKEKLKKEYQEILQKILEQKENILSSLSELSKPGANKKEISKRLSGYIAELFGYMKDINKFGTLFPTKFDNENIDLVEQKFRYFVAKQFNLPDILPQSVGHGRKKTATNIYSKKNIYEIYADILDPLREGFGDDGNSPAVAQKLKELILHDPKFDKELNDLRTKLVDINADLLDPKSFEEYIIVDEKEGVLMINQNKLYNFLKDLLKIKYKLDIPDDVIAEINKIVVENYRKVLERASDTILANCANVPDAEKNVCKLAWQKYIVASFISVVVSDRVVDAILDNIDVDEIKDPALKLLIERYNSVNFDEIKLFLIDMAINVALMAIPMGGALAIGRLGIGVARWGMRFPILRSLGATRYGRWGLETTGFAAGAAAGFELGYDVMYDWEKLKDFHNFIRSSEYLKEVARWFGYATVFRLVGMIASRFVELGIKPNDKILIKIGKRGLVSVLDAGGAIIVDYNVEEVLPVLLKKIPKIGEKISWEEGEYQMSMQAFVEMFVFSALARSLGMTEKRFKGKLYNLGFGKEVIENGKNSFGIKYEKVNPDKHGSLSESAKSGVEKIKSIKFSSDYFKNLVKRKDKFELFREEFRKQKAGINNLEKNLNKSNERFNEIRRLSGKIAKKQREIKDFLNDLDISRLDNIGIPDVKKQEILQKINKLRQLNDELNKLKLNLSKAENEFKQLEYLKIQGRQKLNNIEESVSKLSKKEGEYKQLIEDLDKLPDKELIENKKEFLKEIDKDLFEKYKQYYEDKKLGVDMISGDDLVEKIKKIKTRFIQEIGKKASKLDSEKKKFIKEKENIEKDLGQIENKEKLIDQLNGQIDYILNEEITPIKNEIAKELKPLQDRLSKLQDKIINRKSSQKDKIENIKSEIEAKKGNINKLLTQDIKQYNVTFDKPVKLKLKYNRRNEFKELQFNKGLLIESNGQKYMIVEGTGTTKGKYILKLEGDGRTIRQIHKVEDFVKNNLEDLANIIEGQIINPKFREKLVDILRKNKEKLGIKEKITKDNVIDILWRLAGTTRESQKKGWDIIKHTVGALALSFLPDLFIGEDKQADIWTLGWISKNLGETLILNGIFSLEGKKKVLALIGYAIIVYGRQGYDYLTDEKHTVEVIK